MISINSNRTAPSQDSTKGTAVARGISWSQRRAELDEKQKKRESEKIDRLAGWAFTAGSFLGLVSGFISCAALFGII